MKNKVTISKDKYDELIQIGFAYHHGFLRNPITSTLRKKIINRDKGICQICGKKLKNSEIHIDHKIPASYGGQEDEINLRVVCKSCNINRCSQGIDWEDWIKIVRGKRIIVSAYLASLVGKNSWLTQELYALMKILETYSEEDVIKRKPELKSCYIDSCDGLIVLGEEAKI